MERVFGGKPGEPVPAVDPEDVKAVWSIGREVERTHPGQQIAIATGIFEQACKPGADVQAVAYRASWLSLIMSHGRELLEDCIQGTEPTDAIFRAAALAPMQWMEVGVVREGLPIDEDEFKRLARGE